MYRKISVFDNPNVKGKFIQTTATKLLGILNIIPIFKNLFTSNFFINHSSKLSL